MDGCKYMVCAGTYDLTIAFLRSVDGQISACAAIAKLVLLIGELLACLNKKCGNVQTLFLCIVYVYS